MHEDDGEEAKMTVDKLHMHPTNLVKYKPMNLKIIRESCSIHKNEAIYLSDTCHFKPIKCMNFFVAICYMLIVPSD